MAVLPLSIPAREISAQMNVTMDEIKPMSLSKEIYGDGHSHMVNLDRSQIEDLIRESKTIAKSEPSTIDGHKHWVLVTVR